MTTQHTMADPIHEAFAEHRKVLAQRDELVAALQNIAEAVEYGIAHADVRAECGEIARAALAKVAS